MKIEVNIEKRYAFLILGIILALGIGGYVYAYNSNMGPSVMGHSAGELEVTLANGTVVNLQNAITNNFIGGGQPICSTNQVLTYNSGGWSCVPNVYKAYAIMDAGFWCDSNNGNDYGVAHIFLDGTITRDLCRPNGGDEISSTPFLFNSTSVRKVILNVSYIPDNNWPAVGTTYVFDGGGSGLRFNQLINVYSANGRSISLNVAVYNESGLLTPNYLAVDLRGIGADALRFDVNYEKYCVAYDGICLN